MFDPGQSLSGHAAQFGDALAKQRVALPQAEHNDQFEEEHGEKPRCQARFLCCHSSLAGGLSLALYEN